MESKKKTPEDIEENENEALGGGIRVGQPCGHYIAPILFVSANLHVTPGQARKRL